MDSRASPTSQFKSINSSVLSLLHSPTLTSIHAHRKNHSLDSPGKEQAAGVWVKSKGLSMCSCLPLCLWVSRLGPSSVERTPEKISSRSTFPRGWAVTPWTAAYQTSPSMGFSRQEYWSGLPFPSPMPEPSGRLPCGGWDLPRPGTEPRSPALAGGVLTTGRPGNSNELD